MDWQSLQKGMPRDKDLPARAFRLTTLGTILGGQQYAHLKHAFADEMNGAGEYIPLGTRRPSVRSSILRTVVHDSVSLLCSEGHFPTIHSEDKATCDAMAAWVKTSHLNATFADAATRGSVGSVALLFRVLRHKPFVTVMPTACMTPEWDPQDPDTLIKVTERYKASVADLRTRGYAIPATMLDDKMWFQRTWTAKDETWFLPQSLQDAADGKKPRRDTERSVAHGLGFLPIVWVRNLPGGDGVDGECTFEAAIDTVIEVDYQLSQAGRGLKYAADPRLVIKDPVGLDKPITGGAANTIELGSGESDAKFLEINGTAAGAVLEHVRYLRGIALEAIHGNRADHDRLSAAQSGRAMELMCQSLIWLSDQLRTSYGEGALLQLARMFCAASTKVKGGLIVGETKVSGLKADGLSLVWPAWFTPTAHDRQETGMTLDTLVTRSIISEQTATRLIAGDLDIEDVAAERALIDAEQAAADARLAAQPGVQTKATESISD